MIRRLLTVLTAASSITLGACSTFSPQVDMPEQTVNPQQPAKVEQPVQVAMANPAPTGSLYSASTYRPMFEDNRARFVGDILTIQISESIDATQSNSMSASRSDSTAVDVPVISNFFNLGTTPSLSVSASGDKSFDGSGTTAANNTLVGTLTVSVTDVLPNGYLRVIGEKQIGTNREVSYLKFYGVVNPVDIRVGNTVSSSKVADARIEYRGKGAIDSAVAMGWLSRFFLTVLPF